MKVTERAHVNEIADPSARSFIELLLTKEIHKRKDIFEMSQH